MPEDEPTDEVTVTVTKNGPITIKGPVDVRSQDGSRWNDLPEGKPVALCRCGKSENKPFCDGTHNRSDFDSAPNPDDNPWPW